MIVKYKHLHLHIKNSRHHIVFLSPIVPEGRQTRSRVILSYPIGSGETCPSTLWQTRRCTAGMCPTYSWQTTAWFGDRRSVWCQRSDGMRVYGKYPECWQPLARSGMIQRFPMARFRCRGCRRTGMELGNLDCRKQYGPVCGSGSEWLVYFWIFVFLVSQ